MACAAALIAVHSYIETIDWAPLRHERRSSIHLEGTKNPIGLSKWDEENGEEEESGMDVGKWRRESEGVEGLGECC